MGTRDLYDVYSQSHFTLWNVLKGNAETTKFEASPPPDDCTYFVPFNMASALRQLTDIIAQNVEKITEIYENVGVALPTLDEPSRSNATLASNAELIQSITLVHSAASQLLATLLPSPLVILEAFTGVRLSNKPD